MRFGNRAAELSASVEDAHVYQLKLPTLSASVEDAHVNPLKLCLRQGLMRVAVETSVWFLTGGTKAGVMKLVGEARYPVLSGLLCHVKC